MMLSKKINKKKSIQFMKPNFIFQNGTTEEVTSEEEEEEDMGEVCVSENVIL